MNRFVVALATVLVGVLAGCGPGGGLPWATSPADAYLAAVQPAIGKENLALEAGYLTCAMAYNGGTITSVTYTTTHDAGPMWWYSGGTNPYETAALTHLCPQRE